MKRNILIQTAALLLALLAGCSGAEVPSNDIPAESSQQETESTADTLPTESAPGTLTKEKMQTSELDTLNYLLYKPQKMSTQLPLIVYLHGGSGKGDDLDRLTSVEGFPQYIQEGKIKNVQAMIVMPQLPKDRKGWTDIKTSIKELIDHVAVTYGVDNDRISLTGHSMGGTGAFALAAAYPELFSCVAPMSGSIKATPPKLEALSQMPVWAFVGTNDTVVDPASSRTFIGELKARNADANITEFDGAGHTEVPGLAYLDESIDILNWLTGNTK